MNRPAHSTLPPPQRDTEILVLGGGLAGLCAGLELLRRGHEVLLLDPHPEEEIASWAAAGMLCPVPDSEEALPLVPLWRDALAFYPEFLSRLPAESRPPEILRGALSLAMTAREMDHIREAARWAESAGLTVRILDTGDLRRLEPGISPSAAGGAEYSGEGRIDPRALLAACRDAFARAGGRRVREGALGLVTDPDPPTAVIGAAMEAGWIRSRWVVNAAGAWAGRFLPEASGSPAVYPAVYPVKGQMAALRTDGGPGRTVRGSSAYLVPRPGGLLCVGSTVEDVGFTGGVTAGGLGKFLRGAAVLMPSLESAVVERTWWGFRPATRDGRPILGREAGRTGIVHAAGLFRDGILLAPLIGSFAADCVEGEPVPAPWDDLSPAGRALF